MLCYRGRNYIVNGRFLRRKQFGVMLENQMLVLSLPPGNL